MCLLPEASRWIVEQLLVHAVIRVLHGYGFTRGFRATGHAGTGTVPDFGTRVDTVPVTAV